MRKTLHNWWLTNWPEIVFFAIGLVAMNVIFISPAFRQSDQIDPTTAGQLGDFVGGYIGTAFALGSVLLLVRTLRVQRRAELQQAFENKYFMMLQLHRDNVSEISLGKTAGRRVFVLLIREWRAILPVVREMAVQENQALDERQVLTIAYYCLFLGTGPNSSRMLKAALSKFNPAFVTALERRLNDPEQKLLVRKRLNLGYKPFEGHQSRLGHYYRHLYQTIKYVDGQTLPVEKRDYAKTVRAQLSTHEQALLLLNSLTPLGQAWWRHDFMKRYGMVQNLPRDFFDPETEVNLEELFRTPYFEWEDHEPR